MTISEFNDIFGLLAVQLRATDVDEATIRGYWVALSDLDVELVAMAAQRMSQRGGALEGDSRHWFPKTSEWRVVASTIEAERWETLRARLRKLPSPICLACEDTGWRVTRAGSVAVMPCECRTMRRLEVLGRRPLPALPEQASA